MPSASRQHPAFAAVAARAASAGSPAVLFNVTHFGVNNGSSPPAPVTDVTPPSAKDHVATETLAFHPADVGFQLHTWEPETPSKPGGGVSPSRISVSTQIDDRGVPYKLFHGSMVINPDFLYDPAHSTEVLVTLGYDAWNPDYADALMIARVYEGMAAAAASDDGAPVLFLQSPVAPFRDLPARLREDGSDEAPRIANGMALRMLVGLDNSDPGKRIAMVRNVTDVAAEYGLGLQVADRRFGRVRGEWWQVLKPSKAKYTRRKASLFGWAPSGVPKLVKLVTFVGPARVGSSAAISEYLVNQNVGILAMSEASLQEIAFINLVVPVAPDRLTGEPTTSACQTIDDGLAGVIADCGLTPPKADRVTRPIGKSVRDYRMLCTGPASPGIEDWAQRVEHPLWLSWVVPLEWKTKRPPDVAKLVLAQLCQAPDKITGGRVDYCRVRVTPDGRVKGRAKISVTVHDRTGKRWIPELLSDVCPWAQREVVATLVRDNIPLRAIQLRLAWRERWLGRASTVM